MSKINMGRVLSENIFIHIFDNFFSTARVSEDVERIKTYGRERTMKGLNHLRMSYFLIILLAAAQMLSATRVEPRRYTASRLQASQIVLDGKLDEMIWNMAGKSGDFRQRNPNDGDLASLKTEFSVVYDDEYLYAGIRAWDPEPEKIQAQLTRRDEYSSGDWLYISIDSYNDHRTAFEFGMNAAGVKHDLRRFNDDNADDSWDAVWDGKVSVDEQGWTAEFRIPFRELRFSSSEDMQWGFMVYRELPRFDNELSVWNHWSQQDNGFVSNYGVLDGLRNIEMDNPLYVSPFMVNSGLFSEDLSNDLHPETHELNNEIGMDLRYSFANVLTLDATFNPDF